MKIRLLYTFKPERREAIAYYLRSRYGEDACPRKLASRADCIRFLDSALDNQLLALDDELSAREEWNGRERDDEDEEGTDEEN